MPKQRSVGRQSSPRGPRERGAREEKESRRGAACHGGMLQIHADGTGSNRMRPKGMGPKRRKGRGPIQIQITTARTRE